MTEPSGRVLILDSTVTGGASSREALAAIAAGKAVDVVDDATWSSMTAAQFAAYDALGFGRIHLFREPKCSRNQCRRVGTRPKWKRGANRDRSDLPCDFR